MSRRAGMLLLNLECGELSPLCYIAERCRCFCRFAVAVVVLRAAAGRNDNGGRFDVVVVACYSAKYLRYEARTATCESGEGSPHSKGFAPSTLTHDGWENPQSRRRRRFDMSILPHEIHLQCH